MGSTSEHPTDESAPSKPGKTHTWWHPLLASFLRWQLGDHYRLQEEVPVGLKPLQIDILLLHQEKGDLPEEARRILAGLVERFGEYTLLEFKSPSDTLRAGDFQTFLAYALLWRAQNAPLLDPARMHLLVVAPRMTRPFREEFEALGVKATQEVPSVWRLSGGVAVHPTWLLESQGLVGEEHPVVTVLSPQVLKEPRKIYEMLKRAGYSNIVVPAATGTAVRRTRSGVCYAAPQHRRREEAGDARRPRGHAVRGAAGVSFRRRTGAGPVCRGAAERAVPRRPGADTTGAVTLAQETFFTFTLTFTTL